MNHLAYIVAEQPDLVIGSAYCNWFKLHAAYCFSAEVLIL
jgi:hypothetical protein